MNTVEQAEKPQTMAIDITLEEAAVALGAIRAFPQARQDPLFMAGNTLFEKIRNGVRKQAEQEKSKGIVAL